MHTLLNPFSWEGLFVPLVPDSARELISAPVPFIIGTICCCISISYYSTILSYTIAMRINCLLILIICRAVGTLHPPRSEDVSEQTAVLTLGDDTLYRAAGAQSSAMSEAEYAKAFRGIFSDSNHSNAVAVTNDLNHVVY